MPTIPRDSQEASGVCSTQEERHSRSCNGDQGESSSCRPRQGDGPSSHSGNRQACRDRAATAISEVRPSACDSCPPPLTTLESEAQPWDQHVAGIGRADPVRQVLMMSCDIPFSVVLGQLDRSARIALLDDIQSHVPAGRITLNESASDLLSTYVRSRYPSVKRVLLELNFDDMPFKGGQMRAEHLRADHLRIAFKSLLPLLHDCELHIAVRPSPSMLGGSDSGESPEQRLYNLALVMLTELAWDNGRTYVRLRIDENETWGHGKDFWFLWFSTVKPDRRDTEFRPGM